MARMDSVQELDQSIIPPLQARGRSVFDARREREAELETAGARVKRPRADNRPRYLFIGCEDLPVQINIPDKLVRRGIVTPVESYEVWMDFYALDEAMQFRTRGQLDDLGNPNEASYLYYAGDAASEVLNQYQQHGLREFEDLIGMDPDEVEALALNLVFFPPDEAGEHRVPKTNREALDHVKSVKAEIEAGTHPLVKPELARLYVSIANTMIASIIQGDRRMKGELRGTHAELEKAKNGNSKAKASYDDRDYLMLERTETVPREEALDHLAKDREMKLEMPAEFAEAIARVGQGNPETASVITQMGSMLTIMQQQMAQQNQILQMLLEEKTKPATDSDLRVGAVTEERNSSASQKSGKK